MPWNWTCGLSLSRAVGFEVDPGGVWCVENGVPDNVEIRGRVGQLDASTLLSRTARFLVPDLAPEKRPRSHPIPTGPLPFLGVLYYPAKGMCRVGVNPITRWHRKLPGHHRPLNTWQLNIIKRSVKQQYHRIVSVGFRKAWMQSVIVPM